MRRRLLNLMNGTRMTRTGTFLGVVSSMVLLGSSLAWANVHDTFGVGARSIGMGNAQVASVVGGAAAYYNLAALGRTERIQLEIGFQSFMPRFDDFEGIVYDANQNGEIDIDENGVPETTSVGTQYAASMGTAINVAIPVFEWITLGASIYMPRQYLMRLSFEDPYIPYYAMYKNRTQRFSMFMGMGIKVFDGLFFGLGASSSAQTVVNGAFTAHVEVNANPTDEEGNALPTQILVDANVDTMTVSMMGSTALNAGVLFNFGWIADPLAGLNLGAAYRSETFVRADSTIQAMAFGDFSLTNETLYSGPLMVEPVSNTSSSESSFNPAEFACGVSYSFKDRITVDADIVWTQWSTYHETFISSTQTSSSSSADVTIQIGRDFTGDPGLAWNDTVSPRIGFEYNGGMPRRREMGFGFSLRGGYAYSPSPVPEQTAYANMMDSSKHVLSGGLGFKIPLSRIPNPLRVDLFASYHLLIPRTNQKDPSLFPDENGEYPPGYPVSGSITSQGGVAGFGASAGLTF